MRCGARVTAILGSLVPVIHLVIHDGCGARALAVFGTLGLPAARPQSRPAFLFTNRVTKSTVTLITRATVFRVS